MMRKSLRYLSMLGWLVILGCTGDDGAKLDSADTRREEAISDLKEKLMAPEHGWVLHYQPVPDAGAYYILLDFDEDEVRIQSDVSADGGTLLDQTIPYRVDVQLAVQLTFETYAVFHYLFEQDQSTFGAEFEFFYLDEQDGSLLLYSKSDAVGETTVITLEPAAANAADALSREASGNMEAYELYNQPFGTQTLQQLYLTGEDVSLYWEIDLVKRIISVDGAALGVESRTITSASWVAIDQTVAYTFANEGLVLSEPITFTLGGKNYNIDQIKLENYSESGDLYCASDMRAAPVYSASIPDVGAVELRHTLFNSGGLTFEPEPDSPYSINAFYAGDSTGLSLTGEDLTIGQLYPEANWILFDYGLDSAEIDYAFGIIFEDENGVEQTHYRGYETATVAGNYIHVILNEEFHYSNPTEVDATDEQNLRTLTDELFGGGEVYISLWPIQEGLVIYRLFNPCNGYEFALVKP